MLDFHNFKNGQVQTVFNWMCIQYPMRMSSNFYDMCWPWGVIYSFLYDYESFPLVVDDPKSVYIAIKDQKNFDEK